MSKQVLVYQTLASMLPPPSSEYFMEWASVDFSKVETGSFRVSLPYCRITKYLEIVQAIIVGQSRGIVAQSITNNSDDFDLFLNQFVSLDALTFLKQARLYTININPNFAENVGNVVFFNDVMQRIGFPPTLTRTTSTTWNTLRFQIGSDYKQFEDTITLCDGPLVPTTVWVVLGDTGSQSNTSALIKQRVIGVLRPGKANSCDYELNNNKMTPADCQLNINQIGGVDVSSLRIGFYSDLGQRYLNDINFLSELSQLNMTLELTPAT